MGKENEPTFLQNVVIQWNSFRKFLWNSEEKTVLGRNGKSWAQISLFYLVFYTCLAVFWAIMLIVFLQTISEVEPKFTSYIGTPGLYQIPQPEEKLNVIKFTMGNDNSTYEKYIKELNDVYQQYKKNFENGNNTDCNDNGVRDQPGDREEICEFDIVEKFGDVCQPPNFGYDNGTPCIFVGLNRVWGWIPENYAEDKIPKQIEDYHQMDFITIGCKVYKEDSSQLSNVTFAPEPGMSFKYYPYLGAINDDYKDRYVSPLVAIKFNLFRYNTEVRLVCNSYAGNIEPGSGLFDTSYPSELRIDMTIKS